jgi:hypothetical protein
MSTNCYQLEDEVILLSAGEHSSSLPLKQNSSMHQDILEPVGRPLCGSSEERHGRRAREFFIDKHACTRRNGSPAVDSTTVAQTNE